MINSIGANFGSNNSICTLVLAEPTYIHSHNSSLYTLFTNYAILYDSVLLQFANNKLCGNHEQFTIITILQWKPEYKITSLMMSPVLPQIQDSTISKQTRYFYVLLK